MTKYMRKLKICPQFEIYKLVVKSGYGKANGPDQIQAQNGNWIIINYSWAFSSFTGIN